MIELLDKLFMWLSHLVLVFLSIFLVFMSLLLPITIDEREELRVAMFGYPVPFAQQNLMKAGVGYEGEYPHKFTIGTDFLEYDVTIYVHKIPFFLSVIITYIGLLIIRYLLNRFCFNQSEE
ncbi:hypothetical protein [Priestia megaterium]|uniref:hypothetical protein n=1 Tax=Priestia megaterium TaxID=1404 RepID=UPI0017849A05|nr:hypothetical protein [Priestia megaterium]MBD8847305.1 hypothetical protein [Priestia megaterium]